MRSMKDGLVASLLAIAASAGVGGCSSAGPQTLTPTAETIARTSEALTSGAILWVDGTYGAGCVSRSGSWSLRVSGSATMDNPALSVIQDNTACVLTLTSIVADQTYTAAPSIAMGTSYAGTASSFAPSGGGSLAFYGNAELSSGSFGSNFVVTFVYSDNPSLATGALTAQYVSVTATSTATDINSPNYTLDLVSGALTVNIDANYVVESVSGTVILDNGTITGGAYFVDQGVLGSSPTFSQIDTAYSAASPAPTTISGSNPSVAASALGLVGVNLTSTAYRTVVIQRLVSGVPSYQTFRIAFSHP